MIALIIISFFFGAALGLRFPVMILFGAIPICLFGVAAASALFGISGWSIVLALVSLEIGYFAGTLAQFVLATAHNPRPSSAAEPATYSSPVIP